MIVQNSTIYLINSSLLNDTLYNNIENFHDLKCFLSSDPALTMSNYRLTNDLYSLDHILQDRFYNKKDWQNYILTIF